MFGGIHDLNIDSKGRLAVPAKFRDLLLRRYTPALVATLENRERLLLYPESVWEQEAARLMAVNAAGNPRAVGLARFVVEQCRSSGNGCGRSYSPAGRFAAQGSAG